MTYGANLRGSVFSSYFFIFAREFESAETSSGFARLLERHIALDSWGWKKTAKWWKFRTVHCDFTEKFASKSTLTESEQKTSKLTVWNIVDGLLALSDNKWSTV